MTQRIQQAAKSVTGNVNLNTILTAIVGALLMHYGARFNTVSDSQIRMEMQISSLTEKVTKMESAQAAMVVRAEVDSRFTDVRRDVNGLALRVTAIEIEQHEHPKPKATGT